MFWFEKTKPSSILGRSWWSMLWRKPKWRNLMLFTDSPPFIVKSWPGTGSPLALYWSSLRNASCTGNPLTKLHHFSRLGNHSHRLGVVPETLFHEVQIPLRPQDLSVAWTQEHPPKAATRLVHSSWHLLQWLNGSWVEVWYEFPTYFMFLFLEKWYSPQIHRICGYDYFHNTWPVTRGRPQRSQAVEALGFPELMMDTSDQSAPEVLTQSWRWRVTYHDRMSI